MLICNLKSLFYFCFLYYFLTIYTTPCFMILDIEKFVKEIKI